MPETQPLALCPFCGSSNVKAEWIRDGWQVSCHKCLARGPAQYHGPLTMAPAVDRAVETWNRRAPLYTSDALAGSEVGVKALEWRELTDDRGDGTREPNGCWEANTITGCYTITLVGDGWDLYRDEVWLLASDDLDDAKATGQADYSARILSTVDLSANNPR